MLALDAHEINLRYGAFVVIALNEIVFPNLPGGLAGNSLGDVLGNLVGCADVAASLANATGLPAAPFELICDRAVAAAAAYVEGKILELDSTSDFGLGIGLSPQGGGSMSLVDRDLDLSTELVESATTSATWSTGQNISTPIVGKGRRSASHCSADAAAPRASSARRSSYLEVQAVENDCRRRVGNVGGTASCTQGADCASGLCFEGERHESNLLRRLTRRAAVLDRRLRRRCGGRRSRFRETGSRHRAHRRLRALRGATANGALRCGIAGDAIVVVYHDN